MTDEEKLKLQSMPKTFRVDDEDIDTTRFVKLLDLLKDAYLNSRNWDNDTLNDFEKNYRTIRGKLLSGDISGRRYDMSYIDNKNELQDTAGNREVLYYLDKILGARKREEKKEETPLKHDYSFFAKNFSNYFFNGNPDTDLEAWEEGDYNPNTKMYSTEHRKAKTNAFMDYLKRLAIGDEDYIKKVEAFQTAVNNSKDFTDILDEAAALGIPSNVRTALYRMLRPDLSASVPYDIKLPDELKYASLEQKDLYIAKLLEEKRKEASKYIDNMQQQEEAKKREEEFLNIDWSKYKPDLKSLTLFGFKKLSEDDLEDYLDIFNNGWKNQEPANYDVLSNKFISDLLNYSQNPNYKLDTNSYYDQLLNGNINFREHNRNSFFENNLPSIFGTPSTYSDLGSWDLKHFVNNYRAIVNRGGDNIKTGKDLQLKNGYELYLKGMWDPKNFVFYTYDPYEKSIIKHRMDDSPIMLERWKEEYYNKEKDKELKKGVDKKQEGGIFARKEGSPEVNLLLIEASNLPKDDKGNRELEDELKPEDMVRLGAMGADIASMLASFVPVYGQAASGILGVGSTVSLMAADIMDDSVSAGLVFKNLAANAGRTVLGMIPGGKAPKIIKLAKYLLPKAVALINANNIALNPEINKSLGKLLSDKPEDNLTVEDWKNIGYIVSTVAGLTREGASAFNHYKYKTTSQPTDKVKIKVKQEGKTEPTSVEITKKQLDAINEAGKEGNAKALAALDLAISGNEEFKGAKLDFNYDGKSVLGWLSRGKFGNKTIKGEAVKSDVPFSGTNKELDRINYINQLAREKGRRFRLSTNYEINNGNGYITRVGPSGFGMSFTNPIGIDKKAKNYDLTLLNNWEKSLNNVEAFKLQALLDNINNSRKIFPELKTLNNLEILDIFNRINPGKNVSETIDLVNKALNTKNSPYYKKSIFDISRDFRPRKANSGNVERLQKIDKDPLSIGNVQSRYFEEAMPHYRLETRNNKLTKKSLDTLKQLDNNFDYKITRTKSIKNIDPLEIHHAITDGKAVYYWKEGGVLKAENGMQIPLFGLTTYKKPNINIGNQGYTPTNNFSQNNELGRLLLANIHDNALTKDTIKSLRNNYTEPTNYTILQAPTFIPTDYSTLLRKDAIRNSFQETSDPIKNMLLKQEIGNQVGNIDLQDSASRLQLLIQNNSLNLTIAQKQQELNHQINESKKEKRSQLGTAIDKANMANRYKNWEHTNAYLKDLSTTAKQKEQAGEKVAYLLFTLQLQLQMQDALRPYVDAYTNWTHTAEGRDEWGAKPIQSWDRYNEYLNARNTLARLVFNNIGNYQSQYFGNIFNPIQYPETNVYSIFTPTAWKKGGKIENKESLEITKMLQKDLLEQIKRGEKKLERLEKLTKKLKKK